MFVGDLRLYLFNCVVLSVLSSFAIISLGKRVGCFTLSSCCDVDVNVKCSLVMVTWVGLQFVYVASSGHYLTHSHFFP